MLKGHLAGLLAATSILCASLDVEAQPAAIAQPAATAAPRIIVFEAQVGESSLAETMLLERLQDELEALGLVARLESLLKIVGGRVPRPGIADPAVTLPEIARLVEAGHSAFTQGDFETAIDLLTKAKRLIQRNPALLVLDTGNSDMIVQAYASLGFSQNKHKQATKRANRSTDRGKVIVEAQDPLKLTPEAEATLTELVRMYPSLGLPHDYGPISERSYRALQRRVLANGYGRLIVRSKNASTMLFVDQQMRGIGTAKMIELLAGNHQVFAPMSDSGRRYEVDVKANEDTILDIDPIIHTSLWVNDQRIWFQFGTETERAREASYSSTLARDWKTGDTAVVIGSMKVRGEPAIIGTVYRLNGEAVRPTAFLPVQHAGAASLRSLALYLAEGKIGSGLRVITRGGPATSATGPWPSRRHSAHPG